MQEQPEKNLESKEKPSSKIVLEIFRHGEKEYRKDVPNKELRLTPIGRYQAAIKGKEIEPQPDVAVAIGSPRRRTQETAGRVMLAKKDEITPEMSLEEIEKFIELESKYGKKIISDPRLDYSLEGPLGKKMEENFKIGRCLQYIAYESDKDAIELKDKKSSTYSRAAGNVAEIIKKYTKIAANFDKIVKKNPEKYKKYNNQMERYLGSHLGVTELFLIKILEKIKGTEYRNKFIESLDNGFRETEGFRVEINNTSQGPKIEIKYKMNDKNESMEISPKIIDEIIKERDELEKKIEKS